MMRTEDTLLRVLIGKEKPNARSIRQSARARAEFETADVKTKARLLYYALGQRYCRTEMAFSFIKSGRAR